MVYNWWCLRFTVVEDVGWVWYMFNSSGTYVLPLTSASNWLTGYACKVGQTVLIQYLVDKEPWQTL